MHSVGHLVPHFLNLITVPDLKENKTILASLSFPASPRPLPLLCSSSP